MSRFSSTRRRFALCADAIFFGVYAIYLQFLSLQGDDILLIPEWELSPELQQSHLRGAMEGSTSDHVVHVGSSQQEYQ